MCFYIFLVLLLFVFCLLFLLLPLSEALFGIHHLARIVYPNVTLSTAGERAFQWLLRPKIIAALRTNNPCVGFHYYTQAPFSKDPPSFFRKKTHFLLKLLN